MERVASKASMAAVKDSGPSITTFPFMDCKNHQREGRNLVVCIDGTSNQFCGKNTNVIEFYHLLKKDGTQLTYYNSGIGTYAKPSWRSVSYWKQVLDNMIDLAIAWNLETIIIKAYRWLSEQYLPGDRIYLIGFSRGAYQVRALSAMIEKVGLIHKGNEDQIPFAYELYADSDSESPERTVASAAQFKKTFSRSVAVHFVGAWDTVSSVGIIRGKTLPGTTSGMKHVCYFRHALALDERRVKFLPEYAYGDSTEAPDVTPVGASNEDDSSDPISTSQAPVQPHTKEVWFSGTHSDIGGGNTLNANMDRRGPPLMWMLTEGIGCGLLMNTDLTEMWNWKGGEDVHESLTGVWWLLEYLPFKRLNYSWDLGKNNHSGCLENETTKQIFAERVTYQPHLGQGRQMQKGQSIHISALQKEGLEKQTPKALLPPSAPTQIWTEMFDSDQVTSILEQSYFGYIKQLVGDLLDLCDPPPRFLTHDILLENVIELATRLEAVDRSATGRWTLGVTPRAKTALVQMILKIGEEKGEEFLEPRSTFTKILLRVFADEIPRDSVEQLLPALSYILADPTSDVREAARTLSTSFTDDHPRPFSLASLNGGNLGPAVIEILCDKGEFGILYDTREVGSVVFTPDGKHIISRSEVTNIQIWDAATGLSFMEPLKGHTARITRIAVSPDGRLIASGSDDKTIRIWNFQTGASIGEPWTGHTDTVFSLAFSPDSKKLVSGSFDKTVRIWDVETGVTTLGPLTAHTNQVAVVAVSPDGRLIASCSADQTVRIWDMQTGESVGEPLKGHTDTVNSVTFTPDGKNIVSGSYDRTVRIWDVATGRCIKQMQGHTDRVFSVAVSPGGRFIASGSKDKTIRIWDLHTGASVGEPLRGHTDSVLSVPFSPDGQYIVSGSFDRTVRRWRLSALGITIPVPLFTAFC